MRLFLSRRSNAPSSSNVVVVPFLRRDWRVVLVVSSDGSVTTARGVKRDAWRRRRLMVAEMPRVSRLPVLLGRPDDSCAGTTLWHADEAVVAADVHVMGARRIPHRCNIVAARMYRLCGG